jgi:hypothetical protein
MILTNLVGEVRAGQACRHLRDVPEEVPYGLNGLFHLQAIGDQHDASSSMRYLAGFSLNTYRQPGQQK